MLTLKNTSLHGIAGRPLEIRDSIPHHLWADDKFISWYDDHLAPLLELIKLQDTLKNISIMHNQALQNDPDRMLINQYTEVNDEKPIL